MKFSKAQISFLSGEIRGSGIAPIPTTCPEHIKVHVIEARARDYGIKPEAEVVLAQPAPEFGRFLRATL